MSTDIKADWDELGWRIENGIATLDALSEKDDSERLHVKIDGLTGARSAYLRLGRRIERDAMPVETAWIELRTALDEMGGPLIKGESVDPLREGVRLGRSYMGGFGR